MAYYCRPEQDFPQEPDQFAGVFSEFDYEQLDDDCDYFCPDCRRMLECVTYSEIKSGWESFYM